MFILEGLPTSYLHAFGAVAVVPTEVRQARLSHQSGYEHQGRPTICRPKGMARHVRFRDAEKLCWLTVEAARARAVHEAKMGGAGTHGRQFEELGESKRRMTCRWQVLTSKLT